MQFASLKKDFKMVHMRKIANCVIRTFPAKLVLLSVYVTCSSTYENGDDR